VLQGDAGARGPPGDKGFPGSNVCLFVNSLTNFICLRAMAQILTDSCFALQGPPGRKVCTEIAGVIVIYIALLIITLYLNQVGTVQIQILSG